MLKHYTIEFTKDYEHYETRVVPAENLAEAYLIIQDNFPGAEITDYAEGGNVVSKEKWSQAVARYMIAHSSLSEVCAFAAELEDVKHEEFINAIWDEWHKKSSKAVK